jgi:Ca2+-binding RTX toxin-like protein
LYGSAFDGSLVPVTTTGTADAEILIGGAGDDLLSGGGGADVIRGGAGDDTITVTDLAFFKVDGGTGSDTLHIEGTDAGLTIDFTTAKKGWITSIEAIDTTSLGDDIITLGALDVLDFSETIHEAFTGASSHRGLVVRGNSGDMLYLEDLSPSAGSAYAWVPGSSDVQLDGSSGGDYDTYDLMRDGKVVATVAVESDVTVMLAP